MRRSNLDLAIVAAAAVAITVVNLTAPHSGPGSVLAVVLGVPLALLLPGYPIGMLLRVPVRTTGIRGEHAIERLAWSVLISLVVTIAGGFALNAFQGGLSRTGWTLLLCGVTLMSTAVAAWLRAGRVAPPAARLRLPSLGASACAAVVLAAAAGAVGVSYVSGKAQTFPGFDQVWLAPATGTAAPHDLTLGVRNRQDRAQEVQVHLRVGTSPATTWALTLPAGRTWQHRVTGRPGQAVHATMQVIGGRQAPQVVTGTVPGQAG